jgi:hypothetical protein
MYKTTRLFLIRGTIEYSTVKKSGSKEMELIMKTLMMYGREAQKEKMKVVVKEQNRGRGTKP